MRKSFAMRCSLLALIASLMSACVSAQVTGDAVVCPGNIVSYSATIPGATNYEWTYPEGWYEPQGQGTSTLSVTCNVSAGNVCVTGTDDDGNVLGSGCMNTEFGGSGGVDVQPAQISGCISVDILLQLIPLSGGGCPSCGGAPHPNISYAVYTGFQITGQFLAFVDGTPFTYGGNGPLSVHLIDHTNGTGPGEAIEILGGCGGGGNSTVEVTMWQPEPPVFVQDPPEACIGQTVELTELQMSWSEFCSTCLWSDPYNLELIGDPIAYHVMAAITGPNATVGFSGVSIHDCPVSGTLSINYCLSTGTADPSGSEWELHQVSPCIYTILSPSHGLEQIHVSDMLGHVVYHGRDANVDLSAQPAGTYVLSASDNAGHVMRWKLVQ